MFQNACLLLTTLSRVHMQFVLCCPNERLLAHVFNKEQSESKRERNVYKWADEWRNEDRYNDTDTV